jgi:dienelactone hydrolase
VRPVTPEPVLTVATPDGQVRTIALLMHGGRSKGHGRVTARQLAVLRMLPFAVSLRRAGGAGGLAVARLRYRERGWNGELRSPVADAKWALDELGRRFGDLPVALVGHSMGGRTAFYAAGHPNVEAVVGLAPWLEPGDPVEQLAGRRVLIVHGSLDRMTSAAESAAYARRAASVARSVSYIGVKADAHAMLKRASVWHELATGFVTGVLLASSPAGTGDSPTANVLRKALAGEPSLVV